MICGRAKKCILYSKIHNFMFLSTVNVKKLVAGKVNKMLKYIKKTYLKNSHDKVNRALINENFRKRLVGRGKRGGENFPWLKTTRGTSIFFKLLVIRLYNGFKR